MCTGALHAREFGDLTDDILYASDAILHLHNKFILAIAFNSCRDTPDPGIATFVTAATDKSASTTTTKPATGITGDVGEQRLKKEVMAIHARDRRRIKNATTEATGGGKDGDDGAVAAQRNQYEEAYNASRIRVPDVQPQTGTSGLTKTNWEPEIKKRYQQPLLVEASEFPDAANVFARMVPICYEEAIPQGANMACAELVVTSAEFYFKDFLTTVFERVRANGPRYNDGFDEGGIFTAKYRRQVEQENELVKTGKLQRVRDDDLLPIESQVAKVRRPLVLNDFRLANRTGFKLWNRMPLLEFEVDNKATDTDYDDWKADRDGMHQTNGHVERTDDEMDVDDEADEDMFDWDNEGLGGRGALDGLIDDCLAVHA